MQVELTSSFYKSNQLSSIALEKLLNFELEKPWKMEVETGKEIGKGNLETMFAIVHQKRHPEDMKSLKQFETFVFGHFLSRWAMKRKTKKS